MKNYLNYCLIGLVILCILALFLIHPKGAFGQGERAEEPSPFSEEEIEEEQETERYFITIPDTWVEVIDDKNSVNAVIDAPDTVRTTGFQKAVAEKSSAQEEQVLSFLEEYYHPYIGLENEEVLQYRGEDNMYLYFPRELQNGISFVSDTANYISMAYRDALAENYNRDKYAVDQELEGFSLAECDERIGELCESIGINGEIRIVHRALDYRIMAEEAIDWRTDGSIVKPDYAWSSADNSYYCTIFPLCNGIPVIPAYLLNFSGDILNSSGYSCILSQERFISFIFDDAYDIQYGEGFERLLDFSEIMEKYRKYAGLTIQDYNTEITDIAMRVIPSDRGNGSYEMVPIWIFYGSSRDESSGMAGTYAVMINAITGEQL